MKAAIAVALLALLCVSGCGKPTTPTPWTSTPPPPYPATPLPGTTHQLSGFVMDEDNAPISGAAVVVGQSWSAITDVSGFYQMSITTSGSDAKISKTGFEDTTNWVPSSSEDAKQDFHLFHPLTLIAGNQVHLTMSSENSLCGMEGEYLCRSIGVTASQAGNVRVSATPDDPGAALWFVAGDAGNIDYSFPHSNLTSLVLYVVAGQTVKVTVYGGWNSPREGFTLTATGM